MVLTEGKQSNLWTDRSGNSGPEKNCCGYTCFKILRGSHNLSPNINLCKSSVTSLVREERLVSLALTSLAGRAT